jgi:serine/threonine-protein kinase
MEYLRGQPLSALYRRAQDQGIPLEPDLVAWVGAEAASALYYAHTFKAEAGEAVELVHPDVSPDNLFITYDGQVKLIDFGIARAEGRVGSTGMGGIKGKYRYMAPEHALGKEGDHRMDLFALGATLYEAALGEPVFDGNDEVDTIGKILAGEVRHPLALAPNFPADLADILLDLLRLEPQERPENAQEVERALRAFVLSSGRQDQRERLAERLTSAFVAERHSAAEAIERLRHESLFPGPDEESNDVTEVRETPQEGEGRSGSQAKRRFVWPLVTAAILLSIGALGAIAYALRAPPEPAPAIAPEAPVVANDEAPAPQEVLEVTIDVALQPAVEARLWIGGELIAERPARAVLPRGNAPVKIRAVAPGFQEAVLELTPDRDHTIVLPLLEDGANNPTLPPRPRSEWPQPRAGESSQRHRQNQRKSPAKNSSRSTHSSIWHVQKAFPRGRVMTWFVSRDRVVKAHGMATASKSRPQRGTRLQLRVARAGARASRARGADCRKAIS